MIVKTNIQYDDLSSEVGIRRNTDIVLDGVATITFTDNDGNFQEFDITSCLISEKLAILSIQLTTGKLNIEQVK